MRIEIAVGVIGSGKSTYAKTKAKEGFIILNNDSVVNAVHGGMYTLYNRVLTPLYKGLEQEILVLSHKLNKDIYIDKTNLTVAKRQKYISFAKDNNIYVVGVKFPVRTVEWHANKRWEDDDRGYGYDKWVAVAKDQIKQYEPPTIEEGFDDIVVVDYDG